MLNLRTSARAGLAALCTLTAVSCEKTSPSSQHPQPNSNNQIAIQQDVNPSQVRNYQYIYSAGNNFRPFISDSFGLYQGFTEERILPLEDGRQLLVVQIQNEYLNGESFSYLLIPGYVKGEGYNEYGRPLAEVNPVQKDEQPKISQIIRNEGYEEEYLNYWD